jgi:hypothetical protein
VSSRIFLYGVGHGRNLGGDEKHGRHKNQGSACAANDDHSEPTLFVRRKRGDPRSRMTRPIRRV